MVKFTIMFALFKITIIIKVRKSGQNIFFYITSSRKNALLKYTFIISLGGYI